MFIYVWNEVWSFASQHIESFPVDDFIRKQQNIQWYLVNQYRSNCIKISGVSFWGNSYLLSVSNQGFCTSYHVIYFVQIVFLDASIIIGQN